MGNDSATGVVFTRNETDGTNELSGEYLINAQGEDVVAGIRTGKAILKLRNEMPKLYNELDKACKKLETHFREVQDIEFTIEQGKFYLLQTRTAKMTAFAWCKTSVDFVKEKFISKNKALTRIPAEQLEELLHPIIDKKEVKKFVKLAKGINAAPGAANGIAVFDVRRAIAMCAANPKLKIILVRKVTKPEDVPAFFPSRGILTSEGGKSSHAALVARSMGKPCVVGCGKLKVDYERKKCMADGITIREGDPITIDGSSGNVFVGEVPTIKPKIPMEWPILLSWAQKTKRLGVRANADTPDDAKRARKYGAEGIGLCRTERMFNAADRQGIFVDMIMARDVNQRKEVLKKLLPLLKDDFVQILKAMEGYKVTIRLFDPPLHEFLPSSKNKKVLARAKELEEVNPMMGHRGVRLGITYPEIYEMQIRAVFEATAKLVKKKIDAKPQIMIPQVGSIEELNHIKSIYDNVKSDIEKKYRTKFKINFGTMLEVVRACLTSDELAKTAEFFSFGTNDLTQAVFSFSREDAESKFLEEYKKKEILEISPFQSIDENGVGNLMDIAVSRGRKIKSDLEIGICGEHGGDPDSIRFCHSADISYVSASPFRIPVAIVAAAQAAINKK